MILLPYFCAEKSLRIGLSSSVNDFCTLAAMTELWMPISERILLEHS